MEAHRSRRTRDQARKAWYAHYRQIRFARWVGFIEEDEDLNRVSLCPPTTARLNLTDPCQFSEPRTNTSCELQTEVCNGRQSQNRRRLVR